WVVVNYPNNNALTIFSKGGGLSSGETSYILDLNRFSSPFTFGRVSFYVNNNWYDFSTPITPNSWNHVAVTYNGTTISYYLNGAFIQSIAAPGTILDRSEPTMIGRQGTTCDCNYFLGYMDETRIYNRALTAGEITALAQCNSAPAPT